MLSQEDLTNILKVIARVTTFSGAECVGVAMLQAKIAEELKAMQVAQVPTNGEAKP